MYTVCIQCACIYIYIYIYIYIKYIYIYIYIYIYNNIPTIYRITRVSHLVSMLNNDNDDMRKRGVRRSTENRNFLGFACDNLGKLQVNIIRGFGVSSDWPHLCHLVHKLDVELIWEFAEEQNLMQTGNAQIKFDCEKSHTTKVLTSRQKLETKF